VEAKIKTSSKKGLSIPADALISENTKNFVLLLNNEANNILSFKKVPVKVGEKSEQTVEIIP